MPSLTRLGSASFPGVLAAPGEARRYIRAMLTDSGANTDDAAVVVSELVTNSITHSRSAEPGGRVAVSVAVVGGSVRVEVIDEGCDGDGPALRDSCGEGGRGLHIVAGYAAAWGVEIRGRLTVVWFELPRGV